ncbi:hypothetical protein QYE76_019806 [Lolium multiflorum]|uniref:F-box domain-containing protein n=1 Tax=Lolium multiflorum TaxID=4521 RepID=A0AAD8R6F4_LOLMU|nr:hypothetical protein QYE76_019806 [Lolium multiflorum]
MSPSHSRHSPPALSEDDIVSVFLRIPPDDPARLVRASLACKAWRRILTGPDFCRLYREFHGTPPMLGFAVSYWSRGRDFVSRFISTTAFRVSARPDFFYPQDWKPVDSRHGRILVEVVNTDGTSTGAVLCAKQHCDHLGCHGPPFLVATVVSSSRTTSACVYSSESGLWSDIITLNRQDEINDYGRSWAGALAWAKRTVINLEKLLPPRAFEPKYASEGEYGPYVSGFAQGTVFLSTMAGLFTVELSSGRTKKVAEVEMALNVIPWTSFYTQDHARRIMPRP